MIKTLIKNGWITPAMGRMVEVGIIGIIVSLLDFVINAIETNTRTDWESGVKSIIMGGLIGIIAGITKMQRDSLKKDLSKK